MLWWVVSLACYYFATAPAAGSLPHDPTGRRAGPLLSVSQQDTVQSPRRASRSRQSVALITEGREAAEEDESRVFADGPVVASGYQSVRPAEPSPSLSFLLPPTRPLLPPLRC
jgi:hypothetical protein